MKHRELNGRQRWALRMCMKALDTVSFVERVPTMAAIIELHIEAVAALAAARKETP